MDALSDVLRSVRLSGGVFLDAKFTAPWGVTTQITGKCVPVLALAKQIIGYHFVVDGACLSVEMLAREVALSRTAFIDRFRALVGMPPIRYVTAWRLQTAKLQLRETGKSVAQLAHAVGYDSEEAFSRAFKREFGLSPVRWREQERAASAA